MRRMRATEARERDRQENVRYGRGYPEKESPSCEERMEDPSVRREKDRPVRLETLLARLPDVDIVLVEGWHEEAGNPILLYRAAAGKAPKLPPADCFAVVSDAPLDAGDRPCFPLDDPAPLAEFLTRQVK